MRLNHFWIREYKNLRDVSIDFDEDNWVTVLIGWNGTGKSNVLEALAALFRDLITEKNDKNQNRRPSFSYKLIYQCHENLICIDADPNRDRDSYQIHVQNGIEEDNPLIQETVFQKSIFSDENKGELISFNKFKERDYEYLPKYVFGYYSGNSSRMEDVFRKYLTKYDSDLRNGKDPGLRRLFYALPVYSHFVLLAFILNQDDAVKDFLENQLGLEPEGGIDSILFVMRQPSWSSKQGDPRFWNARGVVSRFLDRLYSVALAPIRIKRRVKVSLWNTKTLEFLYLYLKDLNSLRELIGDQSPREFFRDLESTYVSELIEEVRIRVKLRKNDGSVTFKELSEGEQQLLTVLGLLRFTAEEESLFLLDEPDTHLNPRWSVDYLDYLQKFLGTEKTSRESSHIVLTTHNPLSIAELVKEQVQILRRDPDDLTVNAFPPDDDPRGMGYSGIVTSDMFGLAAALDKHTLDLLEEKRLITLKDEPLTEEEARRLSEINRELEPYGFRHEARDPLFREYLKARYDYEKNRLQGNRIANLPAQERRSIARDLMLQVITEVSNQ
ncbi:AAA family ATPase [Nodosilinea sp. P-1105]|uniref:AAA family ATPase n=1 Tax=Nodosilinea sp. P-1105 TaxID=2546229 RepID=UPI00146C7448|nr:AAA family ATPase [Nodosilinea sp. P-1105]NMF86633.1 chromosome segregation protein SMC [Nodosilinea sp. P-1105]